MLFLEFVAQRFEARDDLPTVVFRFLSSAHFVAPFFRSCAAVAGSLDSAIVALPRHFLKPFSSSL
jgi:hypothetical protein